jgi:hypothetical protein
MGTVPSNVCLKEAKLITAIIITVVCAIGGLVSIHYMGQNNPVEKVAESVIQTEAAVDPALAPVAALMEAEASKIPVESSGATGEAK